jgi:hypothetical protein
MTILHRWFEEVWNQGRESAIDEMSYHDVHGHGLKAPDGNEVQSMEAFKAYYRQMRAALSDIHVTVEDVITEGDLTVARWYGYGQTYRRRAGQAAQGQSDPVQRHDHGADQGGQDRGGVEQLRLHDDGSADGMRARKRVGESAKGKSECGGLSTARFALRSR